MIAAQRALIALILAFAAATTIAALTTVKQVRQEALSAAQPATSSTARMTHPNFDVRKRTQQSPV
jgi:hypothetical protein